ncbi:TATA box-binding protein-associated factor RNA polymerase I subunit B [Impatiens glandulifera]|uniref:TATA box-binding protein-associated factor RNA polymerase I subunit B n=1 Tax=Impatiens glandulifera TaxID=253017 RepID=UPI001FB1696E|nr:TATA box-binding protein-associated factor RNA polymerase I subunit B [Impatiens glandulifera]
MRDHFKLPCHACGNIGFADGGDGFFYCTRCGSQTEDIVDTAVAEEDLIMDKTADGGGGGIYLHSHRRQKSSQVQIKTEYMSQPQSQFWASLRDGEDEPPPSMSGRVKTEPEDYYYDGDGMGPTEPEDFGSRALTHDDFYTEIRMRYVMGIQIMIQMQCKALVQKFKVSPLICGFSGSLFMRFVLSTGVFSDEWADEAILESESQKEGLEDEIKPRVKFRGEPHNIHGKRAVMIWFRSVSKKIPVSYSLAITYLVCHLAREAILPTDISKWALEGNIPYYAAYIEIQKQIGPPIAACPISTSFMFRPDQAVNLQKLESVAALIAQTIGLELPPVNFYAIASRYLTMLSLPIGKILPAVCRIYEWSMPHELWLSANEFRLPTRVYVMSMVIVAVRILFNLNGFGVWEKSLTRRNGIEDSNTDSSNTTDDYEAAEILKALEARYKELQDPYEYSKDLPAYLNHCKNVLFAGVGPSFDNREEERLIEDLWDIYQNLNDDCKLSEDEKVNIIGSAPVRKPTHEETVVVTNDNPLEHDDKEDEEEEEEESIRRLKLNMSENRFCYIPPRVKVKRLDYLQYERKRSKGHFTYVAHADYYIVLRCCARLAKVDVRILHTGVMSFERRLGWLEKRIDRCLQDGPTDAETCDLSPNELNEDD